MTDPWGLFALAPLVVTLVLAFVTRSAVLSMFVGVVVGVVMTGAGPGSGISELLQASLGNAGFVWICLVVMLIGVLFEQFRRSGVLAEVPRRLAATATSPRRSQLAAWGLGVLIIDDYFGPLLTGAVTRPLTDAARISREKLAFLLDANTASVCVLFPFAAWGAYLAGLIHAQAGPVATIDDALGALIASIGWNFYAIGIVVFALLSALGIVPEFGPMRRAQQRARETGAVLRPGSRPLREVDGGDGAAVAAAPPSIALELIAPLLIVVAVVAQGLLADGGVRIVEAFGAAVAFAFVTLFWRSRLRRPVELVEVVEQGVKDVVPALLVVALAYALNAVAGRLGAGDAIVALFDIGADTRWLVPGTFAVTAAIAFATGTSWGAFAMMMPVALPAAYVVDGGVVGTVALQTIAAVAGGGVFGDNASPVSDTTVLASVGAGSDHMDHVITQLPYALTVAVLACGLYVVL